MTAAMYAVGHDRFQVIALDDGHGMFQAEAYRIGPDAGVGRVVFPNGMALTAKGPSAWEASFRLVSALETYVGRRADKLPAKPAPVPAAIADIWALPSA